MKIFSIFSSTSLCRFYRPPFQFSLPLCLWGWYVDESKNRSHDCFAPGLSLVILTKGSICSTSLCPNNNNWFLPLFLQGKMHHALFLCSWWEFNEVSNFTKARKSHLQHSQERRGNCRWTGYSMPSNNTLSRLTIMGWQFEGLNCNVCVSITAFFRKRTLSLCYRFFYSF